MKISQLTADEALASLRSGREGLPSPEAARRLAEFGPNRVEELKREPMLLRFARQFTHFFALILWLAAGLAFIAAVYGPGQGMGTLGLAIVGVIALNGLFSFFQEYRAERAIAALRALLPHQVTVLRDAVAERLGADALVPGDVVLVQAGEEVPADCRAIESRGLRVNMATLTGEPAPKPRGVDATAEADMLRCRNLLLAGTTVVAGEGKALVYATGMRTEFGRIAHLTQAASEPASPLQLEIARLSRLVALIAIVLGTVFFAIGQFLGLGFWSNFLFAIGVIVALVPEGLLPTVTLALAMATQRMARRNALIRHLPAAETLGAATVICTDKTGTLTENRMTARRAFFAAGACDPSALDRDTIERYRPFFDIAGCCHDLQRVVENGRTRLLGDPTEVALAEMAARTLGGEEVFARADELPFDAERMRMSTVHETAAGRMLYCKGAFETVLPLCTRVRAGAAEAPLTEADRARFVAAHDDMAEHGFRILALAYRAVPAGTPRERLEEELVLAGLAGLEDPPRPEVPQAIAKCRTAGIRVIMVTGDNQHTARAIAREIGLAQSPTVIAGEQLAHMSDTQLQLALDAPELLFARVTADQKMRIVDALKRKGEVVAVTGDGVNDAPALKRADIGIAMGIVGTDVARESADMVLLDDNFASIVSAIEEGRAVFQNIRKFLTYILTHNIPELVPYLAFVLFRIPLPLTVIQILAVDLGTDTVPALALGSEPPAADTMQRPPRGRGERLLSWPLLARAFLWLGIFEAVAAMAAFFYALRSGGWSYGELPGSTEPLYLQATTGCLAAIIVMQVVNVFLCRDPLRSAFSLGVGGNPLLFWALAAEIGLILAIVYSPPGNALFGTAAIGLDVWIFTLPFAAAMLLAEELRKFLVRRALNRHG